MVRIEFGAVLSSSTGIPEFAREAEELGFDYLACGEHVMFHRPIPNSLIALSVAAGATEKIKLLSSVMLLPLYQPTLVAKMSSSLDVASGGRFNLGVGTGGEFPKEFEACGVPVKERGARANEALQVIKRLWTEKDVSFNGRFTKFSGVTLEPSPVQKPHPPIWVAGRKEPAMKRAALYADGWIPYMYTPEQLKESITTINRFAREHGRDLSHFRPGLYIFSAIYRSRDEARQVAVERLSQNFAQDLSRLVDRYALFGTPEDCQKRLQEYIDAGAQMILFPFACRQEDIQENVRLLAKEIIPAFR